MPKRIITLSKNLVAKRLVLVESVGFALAAVTCWVTEFFDPPFGLEQVLIETFAIVILAGFTIQRTRRLIERIRYLEGFMIICSACKHVQMDNQWVTIEHVMSRTSDLKVTDGLCPDCARALSAYHL